MSENVLKSRGSLARDLDTHHHHGAQQVETSELDPISPIEIILYIKQAAKSEVLICCLFLINPAGESVIYPSTDAPLIIICFIFLFLFLFFL